MNNYGFKKTIQDLSGQKYGRWTVLKLARRDKNRNAIWLCRCECGTEREIDGYTLRHGRTKGCTQCAHRKDGVGHPIDIGVTLGKVIFSVEKLIRRGIPLDDVLLRLKEEQQKHEAL